jgi:hypothetical protein
MFWHMALNKYGCNIWVEANGKQNCRKLQSVSADDPWLFGHRQCVQINDPMKNIGLMLTRNPVSQRPEVVAEMHLSRGLDT